MVFILPNFKVRKSVYIYTDRISMSGRSAPHCDRDADVIGQPPFRYHWLGIGISYQEKTIDR